MTLEQALDQLERNDQIIKTLMARIDHYKEENDWLSKEALNLIKKYNVIIEQHRKICEFAEIKSVV